MAEGGCGGESRCRLAEGWGGGESRCRLGEQVLRGGQGKAQVCSCRMAAGGSPGRAMPTLLGGEVGLGESGPAGQGDGKTVEGLVVAW